MNLEELDKCPLCGTPFMNALKPGENPRIRTCYHCEANPPGAKKAAPAPASVEDELTLMPNEGDENPMEGPRKGKMSPRKSTRPAYLRPKFRK